MAQYKIHTLASGQNQFLAISDALKGVKRIPENTPYTPTAGVSLNAWTPDINYWDTGEDDVCATAAYAGENGKDHWVVRAFGVTSGIYPQGQIVGFKFDESNDSTRNHCIYLRRYGYALTKNNQYYFVDAGGLCQQPGDYSRTRSHTFNSETKRRLKDGWTFAEFRIQLSTQTGGTGKNKSNFAIKNFKFKFSHDGGSGELIIPENRPYSLREDNRSIGLA